MYANFLHTQGLTRKLSPTKISENCYDPARNGGLRSFYLDTSGIRHSVELQADGLYEAVVLGVAALREHECDPGEVVQIQVEVRKSVKHSLTLRRAREWLQGVSKSPKEAVLKERLRKLL